jgi:hypothetical protein
MGIRIHKVIGYGMTGIKMRNDRLIDERFNQEKVGWDIVEAGLTSFADFVQDLGLVKILAHEFKLVNDLKMLNYVTSDYAKTGYAHKHLKDMRDCVNWHGKTLVFMPPEHVKSWYRYDNTMDYYDLGCGTALRPTIKLLKTSGIYPYSDYIPKPWKLNLIPSFNTMTYGEYQVLSSANSQFAQHVKDDWCINVPIIIRLMAAYLGLFKRPETIFELKPMIHTYWS